MERWPNKLCWLTFEIKAHDCWNNHGLLTKPTNGELIMSNMNYCSPELGDLVHAMKERIVFLNSCGIVDLPDDVRDSIIQCLNTDIIKIEKVLNNS